MFTLDVCVCLNVTIKIYHCVNGNVNPFCAFDCDVDTNTNVRCEQSIKLEWLCSRYNELNPTCA